MLSRRDEMEARINAFIGSWLDGAADAYGEDFELGEFAFIFEVRIPASEDGVYGDADIGWTCSDPRDWVQSGLFRRALILSEAGVADAEG
jgi:hypothetical protein